MSDTADTPQMKVHAAILEANRAIDEAVPVLSANDLTYFGLVLEDLARFARAAATRKRPVVVQLTPCDDCGQLLSDRLAHDCSPGVS